MACAHARAREPLTCFSLHGPSFLQFEVLPWSSFVTSSFVKRRHHLAVFSSSHPSFLFQLRFSHFPCEAPADSGCVRVWACTCICLGISRPVSASPCLCCVRGLSPLSPERLLSGSLAFRFKLNHRDESSLFFFPFPMLKPSSLICPIFFFVFFAYKGSRK